MATASKVIRRREPTSASIREATKASAQLLSDDLWPTVRALVENAPGPTHLRAAISYVTAKRLDFGRGDVLICDASDHCIQCGSTAAAVLERFHRRGAQVYSYQGLHAKVAVIRTPDAVPAAYALVGSGNLSRSSEERLLEASLLTADQHVVTQVDTLIDALLNDPDTERVDVAFLVRIKALPVVATTPGPGRRSTAKIDVGTGRTGREGRQWTAAEVASRGPRLWMVAMPPSPRRSAGSATATKKRGARPEVVTFTVRGGSYRGGGARAAAWPDGMQIGDLVLPVFTQTQANYRLLRRVEAPRPVLHVERGEGWVRAQYEPEPVGDSKTWLSVRRALEANAVSIPSSPVTQLLPDVALPVLENLWLPAKDDFEIVVWPFRATPAVTGE